MSRFHVELEVEVDEEVETMAPSDVAREIRKLINAHSGAMSCSGASVESMSEPPPPSEEGDEGDKFYVDTAAGDDATADGTAARPFRTFQAMLVFVRRLERTRWPMPNGPKVEIRGDLIAGDSLSGDLPPSMKIRGRR